MEIKFSSRAVMIEDAEKALKRLELGIEKGWLKDEGYTDQRIADMLDLHKKDVAYMKKEIPFTEYIEAYHKVYKKREVV